MLYKEYSTPFSCKYTGKTLKAFAFRVHAHAHGDVNSAYKVDEHEWTPLAIGDPQWPQAFYPFDNTVEIKDGNALVGACTYHNDEDRTVYAGGTHHDEMCNVYIMYYTDSVDDVMQSCWDNTYPQLESVIPAEGLVRPPPPASFKNSGSKGNGGGKDQQLTHHDMEGSKMHHDDQPGNRNGGGGAGSEKSLQKTLISLLSQTGSGGNSENSDYYDEVERARSKNRNPSAGGNNNNIENTGDDSFYDVKDLLDVLGGSSDPSVDYSSDSVDSQYSDKLSAAKGSGGGGGGAKSNNNLNRIKAKLSNLAIKSISSNSSTVVNVLHVVLVVVSSRCNCCRRSRRVLSLVLLFLLWLYIYVDS